YGVNGIVFVYPLYELASYAEGMSELTLPYYSAKKFIKSEYLPSLPKEPK
ncbi:MAG: RsiV family protein, partial [Acinetobacter sp.]